jgi:hypothetical protein
MHSTETPWSLLHREYDISKGNFATQITWLYVRKDPLIIGSAKLGLIPWSAFWEYTTVTYCQNSLPLVCANSAAEGLCIHTAYSQSIIEGNSSEIVCWKQAVSALTNWQSNSINTVYYQLILQSNSRTIECWKSSHIAVIFGAMATKWVPQKMQHLVAWLLFLLYSINGRRTILLRGSWQWSLIISLGQLIPQVGDIVVLQVTFVHELFMCYHSGVVVKSFLLLVFHCSLASNDELALAKSSKYGVHKFLRYHRELAVDGNSVKRTGVRHWQTLVQLMQRHNYQPVIIWDPGAGQYFLGGCKSIDCWLNLEVKQSVPYLVKKSQQIMKQMIYKCLNGRYPLHIFGAAFVQQEAEEI